MNTIEAARAAQQFMEQHREGRFAANALDIILDAAISDDLPQAKQGTDVLFRDVIEPLSDTFLADDRVTLEKVLAHLIFRARALPAAGEMHRQLEQWGLKSEADFLERMKRIAVPKRFDADALGKVKKVFVLSRVTIGADVLLNTPVTESMKTRFPDAEIVFLGNEKNGALLKGNQSSIRVHPLRYRRRDVVINRLAMWLDVVRALEKETRELGKDEDYVIVNTDSRLLQSGLLPVVAPDREAKRYFSWKPSVSLETWRETSQAEDLARWLRETFAAGANAETIFPKIYLLPEDDGFANQVYQFLDPARERFVVSMSLGVGGNSEKRVKFHSETASRFERDLVRKLLLDGVTLILDRGFGPEEFAQADAIMREVCDMGFEIAEISEENTMPGGAGNAGSLPRDVRLAVFQGSVNKFAALISRSDLYIGYDSLGQHMAGAVGRDVITVFAGYPSDLFPQRWKPMSSRSVQLIKAQTGPFLPERQQELAAQVFELYRSLR